MPFTDNKLTCQVCGKNYKKRAPYLKHIRTCYENAAKNNKLQDIVKNISKEKEKQRLKELEEEEAEAKAKLLQKHSQDIPSQQPLDKDKNNISHDSDELLQNEFVSNEPDNTQNFSSGETITVNTIVIETLLKTVLTQVIAHHNKQTQNIIDNLLAFEDLTTLIMFILHRLSYQIQMILILNFFSLNLSEIFWFLFSFTN